MAPPREESLKKEKIDPKSKEVLPYNSQSIQSMTEELVKCYYKEATRHIQNVGACSEQTTWFLQQING